MPSTDVHRELSEIFDRVDREERRLDELETDLRLLAPGFEPSLDDAEPSRALSGEVI